MLLPKLQQRGHRVLLFSQVHNFSLTFIRVTHCPKFVIALDIVEDFLVGEGIKFRRIVSESPLRRFNYHQLWRTGREHETSRPPKGHG